MPDDPPTGRRTCDEIEITPEMIEAGAAALEEADHKFLTDYELAEIVWKAMAPLSPAYRRLR